MPMESNGRAGAPGKGNGSGSGLSEFSRRTRAFEGRLESLGMLEILESLLRQGTSGVLTLAGWPTGRIVFENGAVHSASLGDLHGATALARLLLLKHGSFRIEVGHRTPAPQLLPSLEAGPAETFTARALRALDGARARLFAPRPDGLLEIPRAREAAHHPADGRTS